VIVLLFTCHFPLILGSFVVDRVGIKFPDRNVDPGTCLWQSVGYMRGLKCKLITLIIFF